MFVDSDRSKAPGENPEIYSVQGPRSARKTKEREKVDKMKVTKTLRNKHFNLDEGNRSYTGG